MVTMLYDTWECINGCARFDVVGVPAHCPYCGETELYPADTDTTVYRVPDEHYENDTRSEQRG
jgi:hypothetical protein